MRGGENAGDVASLRRDVLSFIEQFCGNDPGRSVALYSRETGAEILGVRQDVVRPAASVIKVALAMAIHNGARHGVIALDEEVQVGALGGTRYASILAAFDDGRMLTLRELVGLALIVSDNPATVELMSRISMAEVNAVLQCCGCSAGAQMAAGFSEAELGLENRANRLSAVDGVRLFEALRVEPRYSPIMVMLENNLRNNRIPAMLPDDVIVAHKTGSLDGVVANVGIVSRGGKTFTLAVMTDEQADPIAVSSEIAEMSLRLSELLLEV